MEENIDERSNPEEERVSLFDSRMSDQQMGDSIELDVRGGSQEFTSQNVARTEVVGISRITVPLDYLTFHIVIHLILIGVDSYIAYELFSNPVFPMDWFVCTIAFIIIPHILRSLFTLLNQNWPRFSIRNISQCPVNCKTVLNFEWISIFEALPLVHLVKRLFNFYYLIRYPETLMTPIIKEREIENLYCVSLHSGCQMTLQMAIGFQLDNFSQTQYISLCLHSLYIVHSGLKLFYSQRPKLASNADIKEKVLVFLILAGIFVPKIMSFGLLFSYARTFVTVVFIVLFGIGTMALFYDQYTPKEPVLDQVLHNFVSVWLPCVPGFKSNFLIKTSIATVGLHLVCHTVLLTQMFSLQETSVRYLPLGFHCFPPERTQPEHLKGYYCPVENRAKISYESGCGEGPKTPNEIYARICPKGEFDHDRLLLYAIPTIVAMMVSLIFSFVLAKLSSKNTKNIK